MHLFAGSTHPQLAKALAKELGISLGKVELKRFSCGECYVRFGESVRGQDVYLLQSPAIDPDEAIMELFLMCQAAKLSFASRIHVILPHFPYARQDRVASPREPISAKLVAHLLEEAGANHVITVMLHSDQIQGFFSIPVDAHAIDTRPLFAKHFREKKLKGLMVVAPDIGGAKTAKKFADLLGADIAILHKIRPKHQEAEIINVVGNVEGRVCILFDDMIDTAGTLCSAKNALLERGAKDEIYVAATHPLFSGSAVEKLKKANFKEIVTTDSIPIDTNILPNLTILSLAPLLGKVVLHVERKESVTEIPMA